MAGEELFQGRRLSLTGLSQQDLSVFRLGAQGRSLMLRASRAPGSRVSLSAGGSPAPATLSPPMVILQDASRRDIFSEKSFPSTNLALTRDGQRRLRNDQDLAAAGTLDPLAGQLVLDRELLAAARARERDRADDDTAGAWACLWRQLELAATSIRSISSRISTTT